MGRESLTVGRRDSLSLFNKGYDSSAMSGPRFAFWRRSVNSPTSDTFDLESKFLCKIMKDKVLQHLSGTTESVNMYLGVLVHK